MTLIAPRTSRIIAQAECYGGIKAGIARLEDLLKSPTYLNEIEGSAGAVSADVAGTVDWLPEAKSVLVWACIIR